MSDFLAQMSEASFLRARVTRERVGTAGLESRVASAPPPRALDLRRPGFDVIAEAKLASPSEGRLVAGGSGADRVVELARDFVAAGGAAVSVLTEESRFDGALDHLESVAAAVEVPVLRKDFLVDPIQILEARASGASGVLLIARMLPGDLLIEMTDLALGHGMFVLVEVFAAGDLENAARVFDRDVLVGVNCRDLTSLGLDKGRFEAIAPQLPEHLPAVAESGMGAEEDVAAVATLGYRMALVGSSLVSDPDPSAKLASLLKAGRTALTGASS